MVVITFIKDRLYVQRDVSSKNNDNFFIFTRAFFSQIFLFVLENCFALCVFH